MHDRILVITQNYQDWNILLYLIIKSVLWQRTSLYKSYIDLHFLNLIKQQEDHSNQVHS